MICHLYERALFLHAHDELSGPTRLLVHSHLAGCDGCRARWAGWVVEKDHFRRALSPDPVLDPEAEQRLAAIGARIRCERRSPAASGDGRTALLHPRSARRSLAPLALAAVLLSIGITALAATWGPSLASALGLSAPPPVPCPSAALCPTVPGAPVAGPGTAGLLPQPAANSPSPATNAPLPEGCPGGAIPQPPPNTQ